MRKIVLLICLAIMVLSGCVSDADAPPSAEDAAAALISKVKSDTAAHTFEGFTAQSTYADCFTVVEALMSVSTDVRYKYSIPVLNFSTELMGYPARLHCGFNCKEDKVKHLNSLFYVIDSGDKGGSAEEFMSKLCDELGDYQTLQEERGIFYKWERDGWDARLELKSCDNGSGFLAYLGVGVTDSEYVNATPDIFHFKLGTGIGTVCRSEIPGLIATDGILSYFDRDIQIYMWFKADETGTLTLYKADYDIYLDEMELEESLEFIDSLADRLEAAAGKPDSRGYVIHMREDENGISPSFEGEGVREGGSAQDVRDSGVTSYNFKMEWPGISLKSIKSGITSLNIKFSKEYFSS